MLLATVRISMTKHTTIKCHGWPDAYLWPLWLCSSGNLSRQLLYLISKEAVRATWVNQDTCHCCMQPVPLVITGKIQKKLSIKSRQRSKTLIERFCFHLLHLLNETCFEKASSFNNAFIPWEQLMTNTPHIKYQHAQLGWDNNNKQFQKSIVSAKFLTLILTVNFWQKITNVMCFNESAHVTSQHFLKFKHERLLLQSWKPQMGTNSLSNVHPLSYVCMCHAHSPQNSRSTQKHAFLNSSWQIVKWQLLGYRPLLGNVKYSADRRRKIYQFLTFWSQQKKSFSADARSIFCHQCWNYHHHATWMTELWIMKYTMTGKITAREMLMWKTLLSVQHEQTES